MTSQGNCMQEHWKKFIFCIFLCISFLLLVSYGTTLRSLVQENVYIQSKVVGRSSMNGARPPINVTADISSLENGTSVSLNKSKPSLPSIRDAAERLVVDKDFTQGPEFPLNERIVEEKKYRHDDQYLNYLKCPSTVRKKIMSDPVFGKKFVSDIPILMYDEHFNASEFRRLTRFKGIYGWRDVHQEDVGGLLRQMNSPNNRYMFDDRLEKGEVPPSPDCITCAIIGNGGILNGSNAGAEIDAHDYVFRVNAALTKGFEKDVGSKTSFYCFTMVTLSNTMGARGSTGFQIPKGDEKLRYLFFADNEWTYTYLSASLKGEKPPTSVGKYHRTPPKFPKQLTAENVKVIHPDFERYLKWSWVNSSAQYRDVHRPTTGAIMLLAALHTCDQVSLYGFAGSYSAYSEHYYDKVYQKHVNYANHDNNAENKLWDQLSKQGIVRLYKRDN